MKIRTDFVTNSSSYSSVCITIESKELAQLLKKYEIQYDVLELSVRGSKTSVFNDESAFEWGNVPTSVNQVLDELMTSLRAYHCAQYDAFCEEVNTRRKELNDSLQSVRWKFQDDSDGEFEVDNENREKRFVWSRADLEKLQGIQDLFAPVENIQIEGHTFVLTGVFSHCGGKRYMIDSRVRASGGRCTSAISGKTDYVVVGDGGGCGDKVLEQFKERKEKGQNIQLIREADLFRVLGED